MKKSHDKKNNEATRRQMKNGRETKKPDSETNQEGTRNDVKEETRRQIK